jgi:phage portal protein BeeE
MTSKRAKAGGGREVAIQTESYQMTYGTGKGSDWFGPGKPMTPQAPEEVKGRSFDFPQSYNVVNQTRAYETIGFNTLRAFADAYDLLRLIIETRKDAMERLRWVIQLRDNKDTLTAQKKNKIKELTRFFLKPDGEHSWNSWLRMILEDLFVIDAVTLHRRKTRGGKLVALDQIDGSTMRRVLDDYGRTPEDPGETAYQQILKGMPAVNYAASEILYRPRNLRVHKVYGYSPVEQLMMTINIGIRRQIFQLNFFTEGNMPPALIGVPETWTPDQIRTFQEWFDNILSGNLAERSKAKFVPSAVGKTYIPTQETELFGKAEEWLARVTCFAFSISPQPFLQMMNRATADTAQQEAASSGLAPIQNWVKDMVDTILAEDLDAADFEFVWRGDDELDPIKRQQITTAYVNGGLLSVNEARQDMGREPYEDARFDEPMFMTSNGLAPMTLTAEAQGGDVPDKPGQKKPEEKTKELSKRLDELVKLGDTEQLANFLRSIEGADNA